MALAGGIARPAAMAQGTIKIGEINSYKAIPAFLEPYKKGWELAVEEINKAGGVNGRKLEVDLARRQRHPGRCGARRRGTRVSRENVALLTGAFLSHVGLAVADFAKQRKMLFIAAEPLTDKIVWENGNNYTFRLRASTYMQTSMLVADAVKLKQEALGAGLSELRVRPVGGGVVQGADARRRSRTSSSSSSRRRRSARSTPARWRRPSPTPSRTRSSTSPSAPISPKFVREGTTRGIFKDVAGVQPARRASPSISIR